MTRYNPTSSTSTMAQPPYSSTVSANLPVIAMPALSSRRLRLTSFIGSAHIDEHQEDVLDVVLTHYLEGISTIVEDDVVFTSGDVFFSAIDGTITATVDGTIVNVCVAASEYGALNPSSPSLAIFNLQGMVIAGSGRSFSLDTGCWDFEVCTNFSVKY